jgi:hypothetical protein
MFHGNARRVRAHEDCEIESSQSPRTHFKRRTFRKWLDCQCRNQDWLTAKLPDTVRQGFGLVDGSRYQDTDPSQRGRRCH